MSPCDISFWLYRATGHTKTPGSRRDDAWMSRPLAQCGLPEAAICRDFVETRIELIHEGVEGGTCADPSMSDELGHHVLKLAAQ